MKKLTFWTIFFLLICGLSVHAELVQVEDFDDLAAGTVDPATATVMNGLTSAGPLGGLWDNAEESGYQTIRTSGVQFDGENHVIKMENKNAGYRGWSVSQLADPIEEGEVGALFFRFYYGQNGANDDLHLYAGVHNFPDGDDDPLGYVNDTGTWTSDFIIAGFYATGTNGSTFSIKSIDNSTTLLGGLTRYTWYNVWMVIDNGADTFDLYIEEAADGAGEAGVPESDPIATDVPFNATPTNPISGPVCQNGNPESPRQAVVWFDEIWWSGSGGLAATGPVPIYPIEVVDQVSPNTFKWTFEGNAAVIDYTFYLSSDPNFAKPGALLASASVDPAEAIGVDPVALQSDPNGLYLYSGTLANNTPYYWRVDTNVYEPNAANLVNVPEPNAVFDIPGFIQGPVWNFTGQITVPVILTDPVDTAAFPGDSAGFTCTFESATVPTVDWLQGGAVSYGSGDVVDNLDGTFTSTLTINAVALADEGYFACKVTNSSGAANAATSAEARLTVKRMVAYYPFDTDLNDASTESNPGLDGVFDGPWGNSSGVELTAGSSGISGEALSCDGAGLGWVEVPALGDELNGVSELTVCVFVKSDLTGVNRSYLNLHDPNVPGEKDSGSMRYDSAGFSGGGTNVQKVSLDTTDGYAQLESASDTQSTDWQHNAMVWTSGQQMDFFVNGEPSASWKQTARDGLLQNVDDLHIGIGGHDMVDPWTSWDGLIDEVRIYNYALTPEEVGHIYYDGTGVQPCLDPDFAGSAYNFDNTGSSYCIVDLADIAVFVEAWLANGLWDTP